MNTRIIPALATPVSEIGLGCWQLGGDFGPIDDPSAEAILESAVEAGITFFDTADVYGAGRSEELVGRVLRRHGRERFFIATKVGRSRDLYPSNYTRQGVRDHVEDSLVRLGVDVIDLVQLHCIPPAVLAQGEIFNWLWELRHEGKIKAFGASVETVQEGLTAMQFEGLASLQVIFNIFRQRPREHLFNQAEMRRVGIIVRLPLNSGLLSGKMSRSTQFSEQDHRNYNRDGAAFSVGETFGGIPWEKGLDLVDELRPLVPEGVTMAQFAQRFILDFPAVTTVITGATRPPQVVENVSAANCAPLSQALHKQLYNFYTDKVEQHIRCAH